MKKITLALIVVFATIFMYSCKKDGPQAGSKTYLGTSQNIGNGSVQSYVVLDKYRNPLSIGFTFDAAALSGLPTADGMGNMHMLDLPKEAAVTGFNHLEMDWNPNGHEPMAIYGAPHFDFHFYTVGMDVLSTITFGPDMVPVEPQYIPKDYVSGVMAVPNMGVHWNDSLSSEYHGVPFTKTFIYGFYKGQFLFVEPMITLAYLKTLPNETIPVKQPAAFQTPGWYPTSYKVYYDAAQKQYFVSLENLVKH